MCNFRVMRAREIFCTVVKNSNQQRCGLHVECERDMCKQLRIKWTHKSDLSRLTQVASQLCVDVERGFLCKLQLLSQYISQVSKAADENVDVIKSLATNHLRLVLQLLNLNGI